MESDAQLKHKEENSDSIENVKNPAATICSDTANSVEKSEILGENNAFGCKYNVMDSNEQKPDNAAIIFSDKLAAPIMDQNCESLTLPTTDSVANIISVSENFNNYDSRSTTVNTNECSTLSSVKGIDEANNDNMVVFNGQIMDNNTQTHSPIEGASDELSDSEDLKQTAIIKDDSSDLEERKCETASADSEDSALGSLPSDVLNENEGQDRSDGSDSGLGTEISEVAFNLLSTRCDPNQNDITDEKCKIKEFESACQPIRSNLKRKTENESNEIPEVKKPKKGISFDAITVYYFPRSQGFSCVPSQGGTTLGMEKQHTHVEKFSLNEHAQEQRRLHRQVLQQLRSDRYNGSSVSSSDDSETDDEPSDVSESEMDLDSYYFLQPVPTRQRRALLRAAGVRKIEAREKDECRDIRMSREFCGCHCKGSCKPATCSCSLAGIKCQVDRLNFPCGCSRESCKNTIGRIEFNPIRVRTHFIQTLMRLGVQKNNEEKVSPSKWDSMGNTSKNCMAICEPPSKQEFCEFSPEVESCVNPGSFPSMHCEILESPASTTDGPNLYGYTEASQRTNNINSMHINTYTSNILQGKGPPYPLSPAISNYNSSFSTYNFSSPPDEDSYRSMLCYSASRFEEFAQPNMSMFNQYNMYNYLPKSDASLAYSGYEFYKNSLPYETNATQNLAYQTENESDQNWFSQNTLMNLDSNEQNTTNSEQDIESASNEASEVLGENVDNSLVDSVLV